MKLPDLLAEIDRIINASPYSKEEVLEILKAEPELQPDELFALAVAMDYMKSKKKSSKRLEETFISRRDKLTKFYTNPL